MFKSVGEYLRFVYVEGTGRNIPVSCVLIILMRVKTITAVIGEAVFK